MSVVDGLARLLAAQGVGEYRPDGTKYDGTQPAITDTGVPSTPDQLITLTLYPGSEGAGEDTRNTWTTPRLQVRTRAGTDPRVARDQLDAAVHAVLHGLGPTVLEDGTELTDCYSLQSAAMSMGQDANGRWEYSRNYQLTLT